MWWEFGFGCWGGGRRWKVRDSDSGGGRPAWFSPVLLLSRGRQARGSRLRASLPPVLADPLGGVGSTFSRCRRWLCGNLRRERRGRYFQGRKGPRCLARRERGSFGQGSFEGSVPLKLWTIHRLGVREGSRDLVLRRWRRSLVPRACARAVGMGLGVESSGGSGGLPWVFGSSFGFRVSDWPIGGEYSTCVRLESRGSCHFWGGCPPTPGIS